MASLPEWIEIAEKTKKVEGGIDRNALSIQNADSLCGQLQWKFWSYVIAFKWHDLKDAIFWIVFKYCIQRMYEEFW